MRIHVKLLLGLGAAFVLMLAGNHVVQQTIVMRNFERLERQAADDDLTRATESVRRELSALRSTTTEWYCWDDSATYVAGANPEFEAVNLNDEVFAVSSVHLLFFINRSGEVVWSGTRDHDFVTPITLADFSAERFPLDHPLLVGNKPESTEPAVSGIVMTEKGPLLLCAGPILTSSAKWPSAGTLIMGRFLRPEVLDQFRAQTRVQFDVLPIQTASEDPMLAKAVAAMPAADSEFLVASDAQTIHAFSYLTDLNGQPSMLVKASIPRAITSQGRETIGVAIASQVAVAVFIGVVLVILLRLLVTRPIEQLASKAEEIGISGDLTRTLGLTRNDEIGQFAGQFDRMVKALAESRSQFMLLSRQAGMAEVASGVMHNIGNAVTNANVLAETLAEKVEHSRAPSLSKAVAMMAEHKDDLPRFLTEDGRGKKLPFFLEQLAEHLREETKQTQQDINALREGLQHVKQIIAAQQDFAKVSSVIEPLNLVAVVRQAITLVQASAHKHGIAIELQTEADPVVSTDRSQLQQIVLNLLNNAKDAVKDNAAAQKCIRVCVGATSEDRVFIEVRDNGNGIKPENLTRIFAVGFTTKPTGHGHGLHYSSTTVKTLGGTLSARSEGEGRGATFRVELPSMGPVTEGSPR